MSSGQGRSHLIDGLRQLLVEYGKPGRSGVHELLAQARTPPEPEPVDQQPVKAQPEAANPGTPLEQSQEAPVAPPSFNDAAATPTAPQQRWHSRTAASTPDSEQQQQQQQCQRWQPQQQLLLTPEPGRYPPDLGRLARRELFEDGADVQVAPGEGRAKLTNSDS
jgi:hypothetical protein